MDTLTDQKAALYASMAAQLAPYAPTDEAWADTGDARFAQARVLDAQLFRDRTDEHVSVKRYRAVCIQLTALYVQGGE